MFCSQVSVHHLDSRKVRKRKKKMQYIIWSRPFLFIVYCLLFIVYCLFFFFFFSYIFFFTVYFFFFPVQLNSYAFYFQKRKKRKEKERKKERKKIILPVFFFFFFILRPKSERGLDPKTRGPSHCCCVPDLRTWLVCLSFCATKRRERPGESWKQIKYD